MAAIPFIYIGLIDHDLKLAPKIDIDEKKIGKKAGYKLAQHTH